MPDAAGGTATAGQGGAVKPASRAMAITGLGAVSPVGDNALKFTRALRNGTSGIRPLRWAHRLVQSTVAAECVDFRPDSILPPAELARLPRLVPMALSAAREAMQHAGLCQWLSTQADARAASRRIGLVLGTGAGGIDFTLDQMGAAGDGAVRASLWTITNATHGNLAGELSIQLGLRGPSLCISTGCASSSDAAGLALEMLRSDRPGTPDALVVVGADAHIRWETLHGMELLRVIAVAHDRDGGPRAASRPFDRHRRGFILGEGAWAFVLERPSFASERGARSLGHVLGYGATCDAFHRVRPDPDMAECVRAMLDAIGDAGLSPDRIQAVQYHGTATPVNDAAETRAVRAAFGPHADSLAGSSIKSMIGHPQGACGAASFVAMIGALSGLDGGAPFIPPTINLDTPDPECDLDYTPNAPRPTAARIALINCLAFGAKNSALVVAANV